LLKQGALGAFFGNFIARWRAAAYENALVDDISTRQHFNSHATHYSRFPLAGYPNYRGAGVCYTSVVPRHLLLAAPEGIMPLIRFHDSHQIAYLFEQ
jgi:hypothetical protein